MHHGYRQIERHTTIYIAISVIKISFNIGEYPCRIPAVYEKFLLSFWFLSTYVDITERWFNPVAKPFICPARLF